MEQAYEIISIPYGSKTVDIRVPEKCSLSSLPMYPV